MPMSPRLLRPRAAGGFDPRTIAGLEWWIDAADSASVTLDSTRVATINDKSGKARHASNLTSGSTQPSYITAGRNGRNVMRFVSASNQRLNAGVAGDFNFLHTASQSMSFVVFSSLNFTIGRAVLGTSTAGETTAEIGAHFTTNTNGRLITRITNGSGYVAASNVPASSLSDDTLLVFQWAADLTQSPGNDREELAFNSNTDVGATAIGTNGASPSSSDSSYPMWLGRRGTAGTPAAFSGDIAEVLVFSRTLTAAERLAVRSYLYGKWGITGT